MFDPSQEIIIRLPAAELNEILTQMQRSITWTQHILQKVALQAAQQEPGNAVPQTPPPPTREGATVAPLGRRPRPASVITDDPAA